MPEQRQREGRVTRREALSVVATAGGVAVAGCIGGDGDDGGATPVPEVPDRECDGVVPSLETAKAGEYRPLSRPLFTYPRVGALERPEVAAFARLFAEASASDLVSQVGYVPNPESDAEQLLSDLNDVIAEAGGPPPGEEGELSGEVNIAGSSTVFPVAEALAEEFQRDHPDVSVSVQSTGSGGGFSNFFCEGKTDFNNASRPIKEEERQLCADNDVGFFEMSVATDALTVVVNNDNDWADCLTVSELEQIWEPDGAERWSDLYDEWPDEEIERHGAAETSGTFDYFTEEIMGETGRHTGDYSPTEQDNLILQGVKGSRYAIGYFGFAYYSSNPDQATAVAIDLGE